MKKKVISYVSYIGYFDDCICQLRLVGFSYPVNILCKSKNGKKCLKYIAEKMSLYDIVSKKNHQIIIYAYACIIISQLISTGVINFSRYLLFSQCYVRLMSPNKDETGLELQSEIIKWV